MGMCVARGGTILGKGARVGRGRASPGDMLLCGGRGGASPGQGFMFVVWLKVKGDGSRGCMLQGGAPYGARRQG